MKHPSRPRLVTAAVLSTALLAASTGGTLAANPCAAKNPCAAESAYPQGPRGLKMRSADPYAHTQAKSANPCAAKNPCAAESPYPQGPRGLKIN